MNDILQSYLKLHRTNRLRRKRLFCILFILSVFAASAVVWQLRFVGIAKSDLPCCGIEEHRHCSECYEHRLVCAQPETSAESASCPAEQEHTHTDDCFEDVLICEKQEHEHTLSCYTDPTADLETPPQWESTLPDLSGMSWGEKTASIAQSQLGYRESENNYTLAEDGVTRQGYTRYGEWYGNPYGDWSTLFVSFCLHYAGIPETAIPRNSGAYALSVQASELEIFDTESTRLDVGDILFIRKEGMENPSRCAIVTGMSCAENQEPTVQVIEGDLDGSVQTNCYPFTDTICGFMSLQKAYTRAAALQLLSPEELSASPEPTEIPAASQPVEEASTVSTPSPAETVCPDPSASSLAATENSELLEAPFGNTNETSSGLSAEDEKPILNHPQWPARWGMDMPAQAVDQDGNVTASQFMLRTDPYFNVGTEGKSEDDYPKPEANLSYILTNYNFFIFDDLVATNHLVGSAAVQGNTYLTKQPGGSGSGYIQIPNKAPNYFKGRIIKLAGCYDGATLTRDELDPAELQLNISDTGHQTQVMWCSTKDSVLRFPSYFGSANKENQDIVIKGDNSTNQKTLHFPDSALTGGGTAAFKADTDNGCLTYSPYYFTDQYIQFEDFRTQLFHSDTLHPEGIPIATPTDLSKVPLVTDWPATDDQLKATRYQWMKDADGQLKLFLRMGNVFNVDDLENVQIILYPWQGLPEFPGEPELSSNPADRANWLCTQKINTVIQCNQNTAHLATTNSQGTVIPSVTYYTGNLKGPFDPQCTSNASLFNASNVSTSSMLLLPNAKEVSVALSATHVVAPYACVYVPKSDYYGCFVCEDLRSCADHHILPYDTSSTFHPIVCSLSKMIDTGTVDQNNAPIYRVPNGTEEETFQFKIRPYGFFRREATSDNSDRFSTEAAPFPYQADFQLQKEYLVSNRKSSICIDSFTAELDRYFEQLIRDQNCITTVADKSLYKGHYIFEVTEIPDTPGFIPDNSKYYIGIELCHNEAWGYDSVSLRHQDILQKPCKFYGIQNGQPVEQDSIVFYNKLPPYIPELPNTGGCGLFPYWFIGIALICPLLFWLFCIRPKKH